MNKKTNNDTFQAKVDIVAKPDSIKNYSIERNDYTELAILAIKQKANVIKYILPSYKDYSILCEEAIRQNVDTFLLINDSVSNYRELGIRSIIKNPFVAVGLNKDSKYYLFFWDLAIYICYKVLMKIDEDKKELFPLIEKAIRQEPLAIFFVNSRIAIYNELCNIANSINKESIKYMDINIVDRELVFDILNTEPEKIKCLDSSKEYYEDACKIALSLNGKLMRNILSSNGDVSIDSFFELVSIAEKNAPEIVDYPNVLNAMCIENRKRKEKILDTPNILGNNLYQLLEELDSEYELLSKELIRSINLEMNNLKNIQTTCFLDCPIKVKIKSI